MERIAIANGDQMGRKQFVARKRDRSARLVRYVRRSIASICTGACLITATTPALARTIPYATTVQGGDIGSARLVFGDDASAGERDALPAFRDIDAYEYYYKFADDRDCNDRCLAAPYHVLRDAGRMRMLMVGQAVRVLGRQVDPQDRRFTIYKVQIPRSSGVWYLLSLGLKDEM